MEKIQEMKRLYEAAQQASVGSDIVCPVCKKKIIKTTYQKTFCSNGKNKGRGNCKDAYWNTVDPKKRCRNTPYFREKILPQTQKNCLTYIPGWLHDDDLGWDDHKDWRNADRKELD